MTATDVGDPSAPRQLGFDAVERRDPCTGEMVEVAGTEEPLAAAEHVLVVRAPREPVAGAEPFGDRVGRVHRTDRDLERADHAGRAGLVRERHRVLVGQREEAVAVAGTVVRHVAACRLRAQPLAHVPLRGAGTRGQLGRRERAGAGHRTVQTELVADHHHRAAEHRADIVDCAPDELHHLRLVHRRSLLRLSVGFDDERKLETRPKPP